MAFSDPLQPLLGLAPNRGNQDFGGEAASQLDPAESDYLRRMAGRMARLGGWRLDLQPVRLSWSPETTEIHEEAADVAPDVNQGLSYYAPEHQPRIRKAVADCAENGRSFDEVLQLVTAKGNRIWVRSIGEAVRDAAGTVIAVEGAFQDISHLVAMRDEANTLSRRLRQTLESISDAFFLLDQDWRFSFLNGQAELLLGRQRSELEGKAIWAEFPQAVGSNFETSYRRAVRDGQAVRFQEFFPPLQSWFDVDAYPTPEGLAVYFRDISLRKQAQEEIRISNERFLLVAQATNDVIWDWDLVNDTVWWNDNFKTLFGYDAANVEPGSESWTNRIHPEDVGHVTDSIHAMIDGADTSWVSEYRFLHHDGHALTIIDRGSIIRNQSGKAIRMVGSMLDVSPQRELEGRLRQAQKLEAIGQLTGGIAHDFNNLLTVILGSADLLCEELESGEQPHVLAEMIATAAQRGADLTSRLLAFGRKQPLQPRLLELGGLIAGMKAMLERTLGEHIDIQIFRPAVLWTTEIDPTLLESAVLNLAINARDAMSDGGCLTIEMANLTLDATQAAAADLAPGQYVVLTVSDTGQGIAPEVLPNVFEPFFTTKEVGKGTGLGLSMVYGFVKQSEGHIRLRSEIGRGTSVALYFPRSERILVASPEDQNRQLSLEGSEMILVVEDDELVRQHLSGLLKGLGYHVLEASAAVEAIGLLEANPDIALLFTDIVMPGGMNGAELAKKAREIRPGLKVLFTSGYTDNAIVHAGRVDPGIELLSKPYSRDQLATRVRRTLL
jgi:PAS domain S-box-containing protein